MVLLLEVSVHPLSCTQRCPQDCRQVTSGCICCGYPQHSILMVHEHCQQCLWAGTRSRLWVPVDRMIVEKAKAIIKSAKSFLEMQCWCEVLCKLDWICVVRCMHTCYHRLNIESCTCKIKYEG